MDFHRHKRYSFIMAMKQRLKNIRAALILLIVSAPLAFASTPPTVTLDEENFVFTNRAQDLIHRAVQEINADKKIVKAVVMNDAVFLSTEILLDSTPEPKAFVMRMLDMLLGSQQAFYSILREM